MRCALAPMTFSLPTGADLADRRLDTQVLLLEMA